MHVHVCYKNVHSFFYTIVLLSMFQNAFDHAKAKKDGVILPNKGECLS